MGAATADELSRQKEQLMRTEQVIFFANYYQNESLRNPAIHWAPCYLDANVTVLQRLDDINSTLRNSEKHIQVINIYKGWLLMSKLKKI